MKNNFKRNIVIGFGFSLLLLLLSSVASYISIRNLLSSAESVDHTYNVITNLEETSGLLLEIETNQRGYLLTGNDSFLNSIQVDNRLMREKISNLKEATSDNPLQQENISNLTSIIALRLEILEEGIKLKKVGEDLDNASLMQGKEYMDEVKLIIQDIKKMETRLLRERTGSLEKFSTYTPILIVLAAIISLLTTIVFYGKIISDYKQRVLLQEELIQKDEDINRRLALIHVIADKISQGNYSVRIDDEGKDILGSLSGSLNKMGESLNYSFNQLADKEWLQTGLASLNQEMIGEKEVEVLVDHVLHFVANYTNSKVGALYLFNQSNDQFELAGMFSLTENIKKIIAPGEGIVGQCAKDKKIIMLNDIDEDNFSISFASGNIKPKTIIALPITHQGNIKAVIELGSLTTYTKKEQAFLQEVSEPSGAAIFSSQARRRMQELLEETQAQSEELQAQHAELENINEELRVQQQKLQVSEEELKVQQEELMQTNTELEERTTMLEEKNQMIIERNEEIQLKAKELAISTKYKSEFLANMSHELRTPLNSILLLSRLMVENNHENLNNDQIEYAQVIQSSGQGLLTLIDEILDLSRIEAGKMQMDFQKVGLREITNDIRSLFAPVAKEKGLDFDIIISDDVPEEIETDRTRMEQVLKNLISNSLKFTSEGSVVLNITRVKNNNAMLVFAVKDTGIGIPADKQRLIFEAFQQADGSTRRQYGGTGLGLSISRELSRLLGGHIELSSEPGKGSEFRLIVPTSKPDIIESDDISHEMIQDTLLKEFRDNESHKRESPAHDPDRSVLITQDDTPDKMSKVFHRIEDGLKNEPRKVLIVEENPVHAKALYYFLENFNIHPEIKNDVDDGIKALQRKEVNCVILDMGIRDEHSYEALEKVKKSPGLELLPIIVFTGKNLSQMQEGRLKQYVNSIVIKTAHSYQRILDEVSLFLHLTEEKKSDTNSSSLKKLGRLTEVLKNKKVLIADDDVRNIFSLSKTLESVGMNITSAIDGKEALVRLKENPEIDIILMDMMMPEMDGYETMSRIRKIPGLSKLPIIAVTAKAMAGDREKCISSGASDYITKPIDKDQLLSLLRVWLYDRN